MNKRVNFSGSYSKNHEDWQVNQADNALRLYSYFLSSQRAFKEAVIKAGITK